MQALNLVPTAGKRTIMLSVGKHNCFDIQSPSCFLINIFGKLPFSRRSDRKKELVSFTHGQNIIWQLNNIAHEQNIICRQLFTGHVVGSRPMKRKKNLHRIIMTVTSALTFINKQTQWHWAQKYLLWVPTAGKRTQVNFSMLFNTFRDYRFKNSMIRRVCKGSSVRVSNPFRNKEGPTIYTYLFCSFRNPIECFSASQAISFRTSAIWK